MRTVFGLGYLRICVVYCDGGHGFVHFFNVEHICAIKEKYLIAQDEVKRLKGERLRSSRCSSCVFTYVSTH